MSRAKRLKDADWDSYTVDWPTLGGTLRASVVAQVADGFSVSVRTVRVRGARVDLGTYSTGERLALYGEVLKAAQGESGGQS